MKLFSTILWGYENTKCNFHGVNTKLFRLKKFWMKSSIKD